MMNKVYELAIGAIGHELELAPIRLEVDERGAEKALEQIKRIHDMAIVAAGRNAEIWEHMS